MSFLLTSQQCFVIAIIAFGLIGFIRGWRREVISLAFALTGVLFLLLNGGDALAQIIFVKVPVAMHDIFGTGSAGSPSPPSPATVLIVTLITFVAIVLLGYYVGNKAFPGNTSNGTPTARLLGILTGLLTGYFLITYLARTFATNPLITVGGGIPTQNVLTNSIPLLFVVAVVVAIAGLIAARSKKGGAPAKKP